MGSLLSHVPEVRWETLTERENLKIIGGSLVAAVVLRAVIKKLTGPKLPPQPRGIPILGNIGVYTKRPTKLNLTFKELADEYGDMFMVSFCGLPMVLLNSVDLVKEAYHTHGDVTSTRFDGFMIRLGTNGGKGIVWHCGDTWKESRRFALTALRDLGYGKRSTEEKVIEEAEALIKEWSQHGDKVFDPSQLLLEATANIVFSLSFGSRFEYKDPKFRQMVTLLSENMHAAKNFSPKLLLIDTLPFLRHIIGLPEWFQLQLDNVKKMEVFMSDQIAEHKLSYDPKNIRDFVDIFIQKELEGNNDESVYSEKNVFVIIRDLLHTGTETTSVAIRWAFLYLITYPDIQKRIHLEIDEVVGNGRLPSMADRPKLNYLHAFLLEVLRVSNIAPMVLPHITSKDFTLAGYIIPKGSNIIANLYAIHMSEKYWDEPYAFRPERFIDAQGHVITNKEGFMAFGTGPRGCLGEGLARTEFFLFMAMLLQKFTIKGVDDSTPPSLEGIVGITHTPIEVRIRAVLR